MQGNKIIFNKRLLLIIISIAAVFFAAYFFMSNNEGFYNETIAKILSVNEKSSDLKSSTGEKEAITTQKIEAVIMNGACKGKKIELENKSSFSKISDLNLKVNDEVFISLNKNASYQIVDFKRDKYLGYITVLFATLILLIGGIKGLRSLLSVIINICIFLVLVQSFLLGYNYVVCTMLAGVLFIVLSILIVCKIGKKSFSAIVSTLTSSLIAMIISVLILKFNGWHGVHFEEMDFLTKSPEKIFLMEIFIGTLGAIMDIAITICSFINEKYEIDPQAEIKELKRSGFEIGKDIMGTMSNTLLFAYISGSIPIILLYLRNNYALSYIINMDMSLEIIRAITGSIGVVISIPISVYVSVFILKNKKIGEIIK